MSVNFEGYAVGTLGSALGIPGVTFAGSPDNQWLIYPGGPDIGGVFSTVNGYILIDPVGDSAPSGLEMYFDTPQDSVSFKFVAGHVASPPANISVSADNAGALGYTGFLPMSVPPGGSYYEGVFTVTGPLTHLVMVTDQSGFGIDDLVSTAATPPGSGGFFTDFEPYAHGTPAEALGIPGAVIGSGFAPGSWQVKPNTEYATLSGNVLQNTQCDAALNIALDRAYTEVSFRFGVEPTAAVVKLDGWMGEPGPGSLVFSHDFYGAPLGSPTGMLEGVASTSGIAFDHLIIYSPGGCLAIDDLKVGTVWTPPLIHIPLEIRQIDILYIIITPVP